MHERSLGDPAPIESPHPLAPEDFDVAAFAAGVVPLRRAVSIRTRLDLYPQVQAVVERITTAPDGADIDDLIDEYESLKALMLVTVVVEARSREWVAEFYKRSRRSLGLGKKAKFEGDHAYEVALRMIVEQVVEPVGFSRATLDNLIEARASDVGGLRVDDALAQAVQEVNAGRTEALSLDFSQRRSTRRSTQTPSTS